MGLTKPDQGKILIDGVDLTSLNATHLRKARLSMGMLFQGSALFDSMTIEENVAFYLTQHPDPMTKKPYKHDVIEAKVKEALAMVGLSGVEKKCLLSFLAE